MITLRDALGRSSARWLGGDGFPAWWGRSLAAWLPRAWRSTLGMDRGRLLLNAPVVDPALPPDEAGALQLRLQDSDGLRDVGRIPGLLEPGVDGDPLALVLAPALADLPRWLLLPAAAVLRRRLVLPAAAAERLRDVVGFEIELGIIRQFVGHGIGTEMPEEPQVPNYRTGRRGRKLEPGLCLAIEPMFTLGDYRAHVLDDDWTVSTVDGSLAAHFEHSIAITEGGPEILTRV